MNTCAKYEMNRSTIAPVIEWTRFLTWKFKMARQSTIFNRIWPNFELDLYFILMNTHATYESEQHWTCYWADKILYMKIQNGHQSAIFNRIWPNFELDLYFVIMNTFAQYEMNRSNSAPVIERTRFHTWKFKMAASRPFLIEFDLISNFTFILS